MIKILSKFLEDGWNVAYRQLPEGQIFRETKEQFNIIPNTWRTWEADPFVFQYNGNIYIFAEMFDYIQRRGSIGYTKWENGKFTPWKKVISESFHMSYPNVFVWNEEVYMLPETSAAHSLLLYKAVEFPDRWEQNRIIAEDVMWVDTTFFQNNNILYAITTDVSKEDNHKVYLLKFDEHLDIIEKQEIKERNIECSRSAGRFFEYEGKLIRITQDCSEHYGRAIIFSEMNPDEVIEKGVQNVFFYLLPYEVATSKQREWIGLHTYNALQKFEVIDLERRHFNLFGILRRVLGKVCG